MRQISLLLAAGIAAVGSFVSGCSSDDSSPEPVTTPAATEPAPEMVYRQHVIAFDDAAQGAPISDQYQKYAKFSSDPGLSLQASSATGMYSSQPNILRASDAHASVYVDFQLPVAEIGFTLINVSSSGKIAKARFVKSDGAAVEVDVKGGGDATMPVIVESHEKDIKRLEIVEVDDPQGLGLDDLVFMFPEAK